MPDSAPIQPSEDMMDEPENCMASYKCPTCGQRDEIKICGAVQAVDLTLRDDGTEEDVVHGTEWDNAEFTCPECEYTGSETSWNIEQESSLPGCLVLAVTNPQIEAYLYALENMSSNEHNKGCDDAFCNPVIDRLVATLKKRPLTLELDLYGTFTLYAACEIYAFRADEITEVAGTEKLLREAIILLDPYEN